jgi:arylformamidase
MPFGQPTKSWTAYEGDALEYNFNPRASVPNSDDYGAARAGINAAGLAWPGRKTLVYGDDDLMDLDIYPPATGAGPHPVHIFIHGGYWRSREKEDFGFIGAGMAKAGLLAVVINYPLCPVVTLDVVVDANRAAFAWVCRNIAEHGGDPDNITVSGHSAGGHLGAAIIAHDWSGAGLGDQPLKGAVLVSGVFDPAPAARLSFKHELALTPEIVERQNYLTKPPRLDCPVHVIVGGGEPEGWIAQSADYANHIAAAGIATAYTETGEENHFSIQDQFADPEADVLGAILQQAGVARRD